MELIAVAEETCSTLKTVGNLKEFLKASCGIPVCLQQVVKDGCRLHDAAWLVFPGDVQLVLLPVASTPRESRQEVAGELLRACRQGNVEAVRLLVGAGADLDERGRSCFDGGETALVRASASGHAEIVRLLVDAGADKDVKCTSGDTALILASTNGHVEIVRLLVEAGAIKHERGFRDHTALTEAADAGHVEVVQVLLGAGAIMGWRNLSGEGALERYLASCRHRIDDYDAALIRASANGHVEIAHLLVEAGANRHLQTSDLSSLGSQHSTPKP